MVVKMNLDELVDSYLTGSITTEQALELKHLLESSQQVREQFVELCMDADVLIRVGSRRQKELNIAAKPRGGVGKTGYGGMRALVEGRRGRFDYFRAVRALAASLLVCAGVGWLLFQYLMYPDVGYLANLKGPVSVRTTELLAATPGMKIKSGSEIHTEQGSYALLCHNDGSQLTIGSDTVLTVRQTKEGQRILLERGFVDAEVVKQPAGQTYVFLLARSSVEVIGTKLSLHTEGGTGHVEVAEGKVKVRPDNGGQAALIKAGQYADIVPDQPVVVKELASEPSKRRPGVLLEWWAHIPGNDIASLVQSAKFPGKPTGRTYLSGTNDVFDLPKFGDNYGALLRGLVRAPVSGNYIFWIASDDEGEMWLSKDEDPNKAVKLTAATGRQGTNWAGQSVPVMLEAGHKYFIKVLHKQMGGPDCLKIGWQLPDGTMERPMRLSYFEAWEEPPKN